MGGHVFEYMEVTDSDAIREIITESEAQADWDLVMEPTLVNGRSVDG